MHLPALITHYLLALRVEDALKKKGLTVHRPALCWGAQGPDFLFYHRALPHQLGKSLRRLGSALHREDPAVTFGHMAAFIRRCPPGDRTCALSFAYGFLCHLALDSAAHPFVYWFQEKLAERTGGRPAFMHHKIEHNLDTVMLRRELGLSPSAFSMERALPDDRPMLDVAAKMMRYVLASLYPHERITVSALRQALRDSRLTAGLLTDGKGRKRRLLQRLERALHTRVLLSGFICPERPDRDFDYPNLAHAAWVDRGLGQGSSSTEDFFSLYDRAARTAASLCLQYERSVKDKRPPLYLSAYDFHNGGA